MRKSHAKSMALFANLSFTNHFACVKVLGCENLAVIRDLDTPTDP